VGSVGKKGRVFEEEAGFSNTPEFHNRDLEIRAGCQAPPAVALRGDFHFSCLNYGYYCLFFNYFST
jgi:hypothetical protein